MAVKKKAAPPAKKVATSKAVSESTGITVEFGEATLDVLKALVEAFQSANRSAPVKQAAVQQSAPVKQAAVQQSVYVKESKEENNNAGLLSKIRDNISFKSSEGKTGKIVALLTKFGAKSASTLDESKYVEFLEELKNL